MKLVVPPPLTLTAGLSCAIAARLQNKNIGTKIRANALVFIETSPLIVLEFVFEFLKVKPAPGAELQQRAALHPGKQTSPPRACFPRKRIFAF